MPRNRAAIAPRICSRDDTLRGADYARRRWAQQPISSTVHFGYCPPQFIPLTILSPLENEKSSPLLSAGHSSRGLPRAPNHSNTNAMAMTMHTRFSPTTRGDVMSPNASSAAYHNDDYHLTINAASDPVPRASPAFYQQSTAYSYCTLPITEHGMDSKSAPLRHQS